MTPAFAAVLVFALSTTIGVILGSAIVGLLRDLLSDGDSVSD